MGQVGEKRARKEKQEREGALGLEIGQAQVAASTFYRKQVKEAYSIKGEKKREIEQSPLRRYGHRHRQSLMERARN